MSVIVRLQNLPWSAVAADIRHFFAGLSIPEGGVNIVGGELGDAFIAFSTDEDARLAMQRDGGKVKDCKVKLLLSSRTEMQRETTRQQSLQLQFLQMQQMQGQATPQSSAAAVSQPSAAMPGFPMQQQHTAGPNMQPTMPNVQQNIYGQSDPAAQPPSITPMQYPQMTPFPMATPSANSGIPQPAELPTPHMPFQARDQPNMQQLPPGQMPSFQTASPQINQPYQMPIPQVNQAPVSQAMTSHVPIMQTTGHHMAQQQNFQPQQQPQMNVAPNFQSPMQQMHPPGFQTQLVNQPPHFQAGAPRMGQPQQFPQTNQNAPFQPSFPPNAPPFQMANQQGSPAPSFPSATPQTQGSQNFPNSRLPLLQRKPENTANNDNNSANTIKNERARRSRSGSVSPGSRSQSRDHKNRDKDRRRRNSRDHRQPRGRRDRSRSKDRRTSKDRRRDDDSKWGRRNDNKRSTDPKQLYKDYQNPNSSFKPSVMPPNQSKTDANSTRAHTASTNLDTKTTSKTTEKSENKESDTKSTSNPNYPDKSSQQNDKMNKIESSTNKKDNESTTNPSSNSPFKASNSNKSSHGGGEYRRGTSPSKRKAPNDEYNQDTHYRSKGDHYEGGRRRRRDFEETPARFDNEHENRMNYDEPAYEHKPGLRNRKFNRYDSQFNEPNSFDHPQPRGIGWQNNPVPNVNCCVALENFPIFNGPKDVYDFFYDLSPNMYIKLQRNDFGNLDGAVIRFANYGDKQKGLKRNGFKLKKSVVAVHHISDRAFDEADDALFPQEGTVDTRLKEKMLFRFERNLKTFQCLCLEGDEGVNPVFDCKNVYHEEIRVVFNQINPLELFIHYGTFVNRAFVRFENYAKANSAKNMFEGLTVELTPIKVMPCSDEQFKEFKEIVEKEESNKEPDNDKKGNLQPNKRGRMSRPNPSSFGNRYNQMNDVDHRVSNRKDPRAPNNFRIEDSEMDEFENPVPNFNSRTLLPNPPMERLHSFPKKSVSRSRCIIMQGLPLTVHYQDIVNFFSSISIQPKQIHVMVENGSPTGDAFCEFSKMEEADMAVKRNNCQLGVNFVHVRLVSQEELDRAVGKGQKPQPPPLPPHLLTNPNQPGVAPPPHLPGPPGAAPPPQFGQPPFDGAPPSDSGFRGGMRGAFRGRGQFPMMPRGRGRGGFESGGRGAFEGGIRGGRGGFENGGRGGFEGGVRGGRGGFEGGVRGGRGGFEGGARGGVRGARGGLLRGRGGGRSFGSSSPGDPAALSTHDDKETQDEDDLLPESKVASFGQPGCVVAAENIPYRADVTDILDFFKNYKLVAENVIRRYNDYGQVTGDARIAFQTPADAEEAIRLHDGSTIQNRIIHLHLVR
ncbi:hypothetical protein LSTR_LSTR002155 [Laodelphax striatellus]|uniref:RRM domain-containing protein n=1 Tax=Laodelphax striatellus TaxID=195883 RepID=A0A482XRJ5_LAOST|nr:hypothetical protein LSTR_LSTR002155 [Laodelphax striatellus]